MPVEFHRGAFPPTARDWTRRSRCSARHRPQSHGYDGVLATIRNPTLLLSPLTSQEAVLSSSIEGTQATMGEVLSLEAGAEELPPQYRRGDLAEVFNYRSLEARARVPVGSMDRVLAPGPAAVGRTKSKRAGAGVGIGRHRQDDRCASPRSASGA